ncbi:MAG TPA: dihydroorotate dehydrogenase [Acidimicrobiales bacterium]|jgi:dihydroorotate dehydrogenase (NAD+) catalytic subunit|nr:dihydroorotate dehydrogenase [Acidimicrobiales bacterium]
MQRSGVDLSTTIGEISLVSPVLTAAGTSGHGAELAAYFDLSRLGAIVVKSLAAGEVVGNPPPRVHPLPVGMLNSVGLQGPGVRRWLEEDLPDLESAGATVVASIWGRTVDEFAAAAGLLAQAPPCVVAVEVNVSCPNVEDRGHMFAHSATATEEALDATDAARRPRWAKLSPNTPDLVEIAGAAIAGGASALILVNTLLGAAIDLERRAFTLGSGGGGVSGPALHPVAVRAVADVHSAYPTAAIVGVGGVTRAEDAIEFLLAGACAVEVGTATLADPRAPIRILDGIVRWCTRHRVHAVSDLIGGAK